MCPCLSPPSVCYDSTGKPIAIPPGSFRPPDAITSRPDQPIAMAGVAEIFRTYGPQYIQHYPDLPNNHRMVVHAIIGCRSGQYGKTLYQCQSRGKIHLINRSCGNRHCPLCQYQKSQQWLKKQQSRQLPGHHFKYQKQGTRRLRIISLDGAEAIPSLLARLRTS